MLGFSPETIKKALQSGLVSAGDLKDLELSEREIMAKHEVRFSVEIGWMVDDTFGIFSEEDLLSLLRKSSGYQAIFEIDYQQVSQVTSTKHFSGDSFLEVSAEGSIWVKTLDLVGQDVSSEEAQEKLIERGSAYVFERAFSLGLFEHLNFSVERVQASAPLQATGNR